MFKLQVGTHEQKMLRLLPTMHRNGKEAGIQTSVLDRHSLYSSEAPPPWCEQQLLVHTEGPEVEGEQVWTYG